MRTALTIVQLLISTLLVIVVLLQAKGAGIGTVFGGDSSFYRSRRGVEKLFVYLTVILAVLFLLISILQLVI